MRKVAVALFLVIFLCGCTGNSSDVDRALSLRESVLSADQCSFSAQIVADYQSETYTFSMDCVADKSGNVSFCVTAPETISGISGQISNEAGKLLFDDKYLVFPTLVDGLISPVSTPWIFMKVLRGGYISSCARNEKDTTIILNDSYQNTSFELVITLGGDNIPKSAELIWQGRRIATLLVEKFAIG